MSEEIQAGIRVQARELLSQGEVACIIGYRRSPKGRVCPTFVRDETAVGHLVWDQTCHHNLVVYLRDYVAPFRRRGDTVRVAIAAKPCDVRALNVLIHEEQVTRDEVFVIGISCPGMQAGKELQVHCQRCKERVPVFYDALVGEPPQVDGRDEAWSDIVEIEAMPAAERLAFWTNAFDRCIRCYACRQACPACYCTECLAEQVDPQWVSIAHGVPQKAFFHVMRAYHLAGRCVECQACDQACPMHIPLSLLNRKIAKEVEALFDHTAGGDAEVPPPLATFLKDEDLPL
jgi:ferredoxin